MRDAAGQRLPLKSKLLVGVAGMTAAAMSTAAFAADAAPPAADASAAKPAPAPVAAPAATPAQAMAPIDPPKWLPYVDIGGGVGSGFAIGRATAFVPFWQDLDSLMFVRFGADTGHRNSDNDFNLGLGYRTKIDNEWILGAFAGFDSSQTSFNHTFNQFSFGLEAMSADWDVRANAYIAKKDNRAINNKFELYIHDTTIAILQAQEAALSGFDGEVGYRVFNTDSTDVRLFAGAYTFHHADANSTGVGASFNFPYHDLTGPKLRAEVNIFDLDMLGPQSRLSIEGQVSHDNVHHTSEYIGANLRIALGDPSGAGAQTLDDLDRRMADPVRRTDNVLTQWQFNKPEPVIIYNATVTSKPTNTLIYAEQKTAAGTGSYADQTTIQDATTRGGGGKNAFIVLTDAGGSTIDATGTTVLSGETVTGAGTFKVRGTTNPLVFTHDFAPGSGPVSLTATSGNVLNVTGDANIANLSIVGPFVDGIYGTNVGNLNITNVTVDGGGTGTNGMVFHQSDTSGTSNIVISNSSITGVTGDGIDLTTSQTTGSSTTNLGFSNGVISAGAHGVDVASTASGTSNATVYAGIHDSTITAGGTGVTMTGATTGGATLAQTLLVDPTVIHVAGGTGIYVHGNITAGTLTQNLTVDDVEITGTADGGLRVSAQTAGGHLFQNVSVDDFAIATLSAGANGIAIMADSEGGSIIQTADLRNITANNAGTGLELDAVAGHGGYVNQTVNVENIQVSGAQYYGLNLDAYAHQGATVLQTLDVSSLTANGEGYSGVHAYVGAYGTATENPAVAAQYITINGASISNNGGDGVYADAAAIGNAVVRQDLNILNATIDNNFRGIVVDGYAFNGGSSQQNIYFAYDTVEHNTQDGVDLHVYAGSGNGFAAQYGTIYNVDASYNGSDGFDIGARANEADAEQQFYMVDVTGDHEGGNGLQVVSNASGYTAGSYTNYPAHLQQNIYAIYGSFSNNAAAGVVVYNTAAGGAAIDQSIFLYGLDISHNARSGVYEYSRATGTSAALPTHLYADLQVLNSVVDYNGFSGIYQFSNSVGPTDQRSHTTISGTDASYNGSYGFGNHAESSEYFSTNLQYVTLANSRFDHNGLSGAFFEAHDYYGPGPYGFAGHIVTVVNSDFSYNADDGLRAFADASGENGRAEQYFTLEYSNFSHNGQNGFDDFNRATDGKLNTYNGTTYYCNYVQSTVGGCAIVRSSTTVVGSTFNNNANTGIYIGSLAQNYGTIYSAAGHSGAPSLYVTGSTISNNGNAGIAVLSEAAKYSAVSGLTVIDSTKITNNGTDGTSFSGGPIGSLPQGGLIVLDTSKYFSFNNQVVFVENGSSVSDNKGVGIVVAGYAGLTYQQSNVLVVLDSQVNGNYTGAAMTTLGIDVLDLEQQFYAGGSSFSNNTVGVAGPKYAGSGVTIGMLAEGASYVLQYAGSAGSTFSGNEGAGLTTYLVGGVNLATVQYVTSTDDTFSGNAEDGLHVNLLNKYSPTPATNWQVQQEVKLVGDTFNAAAGTSGASITAYVDNATATQLVYVYSDAAGHGNSFTGGQYGMFLSGNLDRDATLATTAVVSGATFDSNAVGIFLMQHGYNYAATGTFGVYGNTFSNNGFSAIGGFEYYATQAINIQGNTIDNLPGAFGIAFEAVSGSDLTVDVHTNAQTGGTPYLFAHDGSSTITVTY